MFVTAICFPSKVEMAEEQEYLGLSSTLIRHESEALFLRLGLPSTLIRHENETLFGQLGLSSTLIRHENGALCLRLGLPSTRHDNHVVFLSEVSPYTQIYPGLESTFSI